MLIKDICKKELISVSLNDNLKKVCEIMKINDIGFLPVFNDKKIVGVITDRDIAIRGISQNIDQIELIMSANPISIDINQDTKEALKKLKQYKIKRLLIKEDTKYVGVISLSDILKSNDDKEILNTIKIIFQEKPNEDLAKIDSFEL